MRVVDGAVIRDIPYPGCIGDAMRETANLKCMLRKIEEKHRLSSEWEALKNKLRLDVFITPQGWVRHKDAPHEGLQVVPLGYLNGGESVVVKDSWRERDTSGDQCILWYREATPEQRKAMRWNIIKRGFRYPNGDFIHPGMFAELTNWNWLRKQNLNTQVDLFEQKFRYNDELNKFEPMENSSADYWVWSAIACDYEGWPANRVGADILKTKFTHYLRDEPNGQWYLDIACTFSDLYFGG